VRPRQELNRGGAPRARCITWGCGTPGSGTIPAGTNTAPGSCIGWGPRWRTSREISRVDGNAHPARAQHHGGGSRGGIPRWSVEMPQTMTVTWSRLAPPQRHRKLHTAAPRRHRRLCLPRVRRRRPGSARVPGSAAEEHTGAVSTPGPIWGQRDPGPDHQIEVVVQRGSCPQRQDPPGPHCLKAPPPRGPAGAHKPCPASGARTQTRNDVGQSSCPDGPVSLPWNPVGGSPSQWDEAAARTHSRRSGR